MLNLHAQQIFNTSKGTITVELYKEGAPDVINEFIDAW